MEKSFENQGQFILNYENEKFLLKTFTPSEEDLNLIPSYHLINVEELSKYGGWVTSTDLNQNTKFAIACQINFVG